MGFEKKIAIRPIPRESDRLPRTPSQEAPTGQENPDVFFEYKTGDNQVLKDMFKSLIMSLSTDDFETFCDNTLEKEALLEDFTHRKSASEKPDQYAYITYAMEILREADTKTSSH